MIVIKSASVFPLAMSLLPVLLLHACSLLPVSMDPHLSGLVQSVEGQPRILRIGVYRALGERSGLEPGDTILTGAGDALVVRMRDGTRISLGERTQLDLPDSQASAGDTAWTLIDGLLLVEAGGGFGGRRADFSLHTPLATLTAGSRAGWAVNLDATGRLSICLLEAGRLVVSSRWDTRVLSAAGSGVVVPLDAAPEAVSGCTDNDWLGGLQSRLP